MESGVSQLPQPTLRIPAQESLKLLRAARPALGCRSQYTGCVAPLAERKPAYDAREGISAGFIDVNRNRMSRPRNTEPQANGALARALIQRNPDWNDSTVHAERTGVIRQAVPSAGTGKRPDILVAPPRRQPVIVETEFAPARTVEQDATARLGTRLHSTGEDIEGVLSVVLPESLKTGDLETVDQVSFRFATHFLNARGECIRWPPERAWVEGSVDDLADAIEWLSLSERQLSKGTEALEQVVRNAAGLLAEHAGEGPLARVAGDLHQAAGEQTERMGRGHLRLGIRVSRRDRRAGAHPSSAASGLDRQGDASEHMERNPRGELLAHFQHCPRRRD